MKRIVILLVCLCILTSCSKDNEDFSAYTFSTNSQLNIESQEGSYMKYATVVGGNNMVFKYVFERADEEDIADDEYSEFIYFEIDSSLEEFNYVDEELSAINAVFTQSCFCAFFDETKDVPPTGFIRGKKISEKTWDINIDVIFYGDEPKTGSNTFRLK